MAPNLVRLRPRHDDAGGRTPITTARLRLRNPTSMAHRHHDRRGVPTRRYRSAALTRLRDPETIGRCTSRFWARFRTSKPSPSGLEFVKSPGCEGCTAAAAGASGRASPACDWPMARSASLRYTGTKPPALGAGSSRSSTCFDIRAMAKSQAKQLVVCVSNEGYPAPQERRHLPSLQDGPGSTASSGSSIIRRRLPLSGGAVPLDRAAPGCQEGSLAAA